MADNTNHSIKNLVFDSDNNNDNVIEQETTQLDPQTTQLTESIHIGQQQSLYSRLPFKDIRAAAIKKSAEKHTGITFLDVLELVDDPRYTPRQASQLLRNHKRNGNLFTCNRTCPQKYYLTVADAEYAAQKDSRTTQLHPTVVDSSTNLSNAAVATPPPTTTTTTTATATELLLIEQTNLYQCLLLFETAPICIHNLHLSFTLLDNGAETYYDRLRLLPTTAVNNAKTITRQITRHRRVTYNIYPHGKVELLVSCSKYPFPIASATDVTALFGFLHQTQYILSLNLSDTTNSLFVPAVHNWTLTEADINKDVRCPNPLQMHYEGPKVQLTTLEGTLRLYLKLIDGESYVRLEEMKVFNTAFDEAINSLRPNKKNLSAAPPPPQKKEDSSW